MSRALSILERLESIAHPICHGRFSLGVESIDELRKRHKQESKGLLVLVRQLKLRVNREVEFRHQAGEQKDYLARTIEEKQAT